MDIKYRANESEHRILESRVSTYMISNHQHESHAGTENDFITIAHFKGNPPTLVCVLLSSACENGFVYSLHCVSPANS